MITTHSKFLYGFEITGSNKYIDFTVGATTYAVSVDTGSKSPDDLIDEVESEMNNAGSAVTFSLAFNRATRIFTLTGDGAFDLLVNSGDNAASGIYTTLGIPVSSDFSGVVTAAGTTAVGTVYNTQFKLQDYVSSEDNQMERFATVNKSASGRTNIISFGTDEIFEMSFKYLTDRPQVSGSPIRSGTVASFRALMQWLVQKKPVEFYPDENDTATYSKVVFDSSAESSDGTGYKLVEQFNRGLVGYFDTGVMKMRVVP